VSPGLAEVAGELYALAPGDFTAARNARAKRVRADGDRDLAGQVQALRKPTVAAWAVNALVRHHPDDVADLLALGAMLRDAQEARAGGELRDLNRRQHELMAVARRHADALAADAGQTLTDAVVVQLEGTLRAAMTDPDAADAVRSGLLTAELLSTGFGPVEVGEALAVPGAPALVPAPEAGPRTVDAAAGPSASAEREPASPPAPTSAAKPVRRSRLKVADDASAAGRRVEDREARPGRAERREQAALPAKEEGDQTARRAQEEREQAARRAKEEREQAAARARRAAAEEDAALAQQHADEAADALRAAEDAVDALGRRHAELAAQIDELTARVHELEAQRTAAGRDQRRAATARDAVARTAEAAARRARTAAQRLDRLDRPD
jgi:hypothetical protein